jgi:hypothetical protein
MNEKFAVLRLWQWWNFVETYMYPDRGNKQVYDDFDAMFCMGGEI